MNKYESVIILKPFMDDNENKEIINNFENIIKENGELEKTEALGNKKLAYEIKNNKDGYYVIFYFKSEPQFIEELERKYRITEEVLKFITIRVD